jgi:hypothetical protein
MFIVALLLRCSSISKWIIMTHPDSGILFSTKINELLSHGEIWRNCNCVLVSERSKSEKDAYYIIPYIMEEANYGDSKKSSGVQELVEGGREA